MLVIPILGRWKNKDKKFEVFLHSIHSKSSPVWAISDPVKHTHIYTHTHIHTHVHICTCIYIHTCTHIFTRIQSQTHTHKYMHTHREKEGSKRDGCQLIHKGSLYQLQRTETLTRYCQDNM